jgi:NO-binding membrane sensor protein with MHYT domain
VAEVHHFAYGWINPLLAFLISFLGSLLGLVFTARSREVLGRARRRWLALGSVAIGCAGLWVMHLLALLGFDVTGSTVRYDPLRTLCSLLLAVAVVAGGLFTAGVGEPAIGKTLLGGALMGVGIAVMHYVGMSALHVNGTFRYDLRRVGISVLIAVGAATILVWFAVSIRGATGTVVAALITAAATCTVHYTCMSAVAVKLDESTSPVSGVSPALMVVPIFIVAAVVICTLAYCTVGISIRHDTIRDEAQLAGRRWPHLGPVRR